MNKGMLIFVGVLTVLVGAWPLMINSTFIPDGLRIIPATGPVYQGIIILIGIIALFYAFRT